MTIVYHAEITLDAAQLADVFHRSGIGRPTDDLPRLAQMIDRADLIFTAGDGPELIGVTRSLTDSAMTAIVRCGA